MKKLILKILENALFVISVSLLIMLIPFISIGALFSKKPFREAFCDSLGNETLYTPMIQSDEEMKRNRERFLSIHQNEIV